MDPGERQVERALLALHEATASATGEAYLAALVRAMAELLGASRCFLALLLPGRVDRVRTHLHWSEGRWAEPVEYDLAGTPCETLSSGGACQYPAGVAAHFPSDRMLADLGIEAYLGIPLPGPAGRPRGLLAVLDQRPMPAIGELGPLLGIFAARAAAELDRIRSDAELRRNETLFRQIVTSCAEGVAVLDAKGRLTYCNPQLAAILGYAGAEALGGVDLLSLVAPDDRASVTAQLASRSQGEAALYEFRVVRRGGAEARLMASSAPILDAQGRHAGAIALLTDVTERHALEEQVREAQKLESLGVLAGGVAHEFNNLLVGILANCSFVASELPAGSETLAAAEDARSAARKASDLTRQLLAYSGRGMFTVGPVDLNALAGEMVALATPALQPSTRVVTALAPALPGVKGDEGQLGQVVLSLLTNASDALQERPGTVTLRTGVKRLERMALAHFQGGDALPEGVYVTLQVEDDGAGMDALTRARIFEPFFTTKFTGRGLGLPASFGILKGHGGAIRVESEPGRGSTVTILLPPRQAAAHAAHAAATERPATLAAAPREAPRRVLVADDEEVVRRAARRALERAGFEVLEVGDGRQAVDRFEAEQGRIACVLLDLTMPGMGGEAALAAIRERSPEVPVVLTSGFSDRDEASAEASDPRVEFLPKPFGPSELVAAVRRAMGH